MTAMQVVIGSETLAPEWTSCVVCVGTFDGVHLGHRAVIRHAVELGTSRDQPCCLVTFDRHPLAVVRPESCPPRIATLEQNLEQFAKLGVALTVVLPFTHELSRLPANLFLDQILVQGLRATGLVIGHDFAMGKDREGDAGWLASRIPTSVVEQVLQQDRRVSSSALRQLIQQGDLTQARHFLGRPFELSGVVVGGQKLGRQLGFPTANVARAVDQVVPADGVYACRWLGIRQSYVAAVSVGKRPAVSGMERTVEAHLIDYPGYPLYGQPCRVQFLAKVRDEQNFDSLDELTQQMARDVEDVRAIELEMTESASMPI